MFIPRFLICVRAAVIFLALGSGARLRAELSLVTEADGRTYTIKEIRTGRLVGVAGSERRFFDWNATFAVAGDLVADARRVHWGPTYQIVHPPVRDEVAASQRPYFGYVRLTNGPGFEGSSFTTLWPERTVVGPALVVFGWVVEGRIRQVQVERLPADPNGKGFRLDQLFHLTPDEAGGQAVVLVWNRGQFVSPVRWFGERVQGALEQMLAGNEAAFAGALGKDVNARTTGRSGLTLLHFAAEAGMARAIPHLLRDRALVNTADFFAPLQAAAANGHLAVVEQLLAAGADPQRADLLAILRCGHDDVAARLLASDPKFFRGDNASLLAAIEGGFTGIAAALLERGASFPFLARGAGLLLIERAERGQTRMIEFLLAQKMDANTMLGGRTSLGIAAMTGNQPMLDALLRGGANVNLPDSFGSTPLMQACSTNNLRMAEVLLGAGADVTRKMNSGLTALHYAALNNWVPLMQQFRDRGADLNALGAGNERPLDLALLSGAGDAARWLATAGAKCEINGGSMEELLEAAIRLDVVEVVQEAFGGGWPPDRLLAGRWPVVWLAEKHGARRVRAWLAAQTPAPAVTALPTIVPSAELDAPLTTLSKPAVADPRDRNHRSTAEAVEVRVLVDETGRASVPHVDGAGGSRIGMVATQHARSWRFSPPTKAGRPVATEVTVTVTFLVDRTAADVAFMDAAPFPITRYRPRLTGPLLVGPVIGQQFEWSRPLDGAVRVEFLVNPDGQVYTYRAATDQHERNAHAAVDALAKWAFTTGLRSGMPVATRMSVVVD
jgi:ankyrin repeat protein